MMQPQEEFSVEDRELQRECAEFLKSRRYRRLHRFLQADTAILAGATASEQAVFEKGGRAKWEGLHVQAEFWAERPAQEINDG